jgi:glycerol-3-phosphate acyltransferase PlsY
VVIDAPAAVAAGATLVFIIILLRHRANVRRLMAGTERRIGQRLFKEIAG